MRVKEPGVIPYNDEVATDPTHEKIISFVSLGQTFSLRLQVPLYMWNALSTEDWDFAEKLVRERADGMRMDAARSGKLLQWQDHLQEFARTCVYNQFMKYQVREGNNEGHAVPLGW
ncbi:MAG TPA: hypothetical protein VGJ33_16215 [Candidatus Angelobacter sp.]|jgi:hypothetical protein